MIRSIVKADLERALFLVQNCHSPHFNWNKEKLESLMDQKGILALGLFGDGAEIKALVFATTIPVGLEIQLVAVDPKYRGQGHAQQVLRAIFERIDARQEIWLEVHEHNGPALKLYRNLGFTQVGRRPRYYSDGGTALLFSWNK